VLSVENLRSGYGRIEVLHGVSIEVAAGEIVTLVGANGAGKTTLLRAISGIQPISAGHIHFEGRSIESIPAYARIALGIAQVPEGRQVFAPLSVEDNLKLGAWIRRTDNLGTDIHCVYELFPMLAELRHDRILNVVLDLKRNGLTLLLVEQNASAALAIADRGYVLETGVITASGAAADIQGDKRVREAYLGV
jgi:branched-chain amino acid transport system ATP-binding protein